jgi:hypothetical protein
MVFWRKAGNVPFGLCSLFTPGPRFSYLSGFQVKIYPFLPKSVQVKEKNKQITEVTIRFTLRPLGLLCKLNCY